MARTGRRWKLRSPRVSSKICICSKPKERDGARYCDRCGEIHSKISREAHMGKGTGKRWNYPKGRKPVEK